ncbi:MAG: hypothetical protein KBF80_08230 [Flavobacteriales bacterium]|nr:hypothetical protein [Flavobacteriales bacterium]
MRAWWTVPVFVLLSYAVEAQHFIDLSKVGPLVVPEGIFLDSVITGFSDSSSVGVVMKGMGNRRVPAFMANGISASVEGLLKHGEAAPGVLHCTMRINALEVEELAEAFSENCYCGLNFELLTSTDSGWYRIFDHAATTMLKGGMDATAQQEANVVSAFTKGLAAFSAARQAGRLSHARLPAPPKAGTFDGADRSYAVLEAGAPAHGIYTNFQDFRDQRPDTTIGFTLKPAGADPQAMPLMKLKTDKGTPVPETIWGVSDGRRAYINLEGKYLGLERSGRAFTSEYSLQRGSGAVGVAIGVSFGLIGAALYMAASTPRAISVQLDLLTGTLKPVKAMQAYAGAAEPTSDHLFLYSRFSAVDTVVEMLVYGGHEADLVSDGHHLLALVPRPDEVPVSFRVGTDEPVTIHINASTTGTDPVVYLLNARKDGRITVDKVNAEMAASILRGLDPAKEVK